MNRTPFAHILTLIVFIVNSFGPVPVAQAQDFVLPKPGVMVRLSPPENPAILKGLKVYPDNPFRFDFILDKGDQQRRPDGYLKEESTRLIKYFLASLTIPEKDLWVNLSPYEKDRIVPESFGVTEMGRDLLAQDYMLKQITASLIYPEDEVGKKFWKRIYEEAQRKYNTTNIPVNTFNKVWIVPEKAVVYENAKAGTAYVVESKLKVMLEQDYLSLEKHAIGTDSNSAVRPILGQELVSLPAGRQVSPNNVKAPQGNPGTTNEVNQIGSQIIREIVIPELTKEINEGKNFSQLRQVYNSLILATWYKKKIKDSVLSKVYSDKSKTQGINIEDPQEKEKIYQQYLQAFKKGVYNYIKEEQDPITHQSIPRKYFSGGAQFTSKAMTVAMQITEQMDPAQLAGDFAQITADFAMTGDPAQPAQLDRVMTSDGLIEAEFQDSLGRSIDAEQQEEGLVAKIRELHLEEFLLQFTGQKPYDWSKDSRGDLSVVMKEVAPKVSTVVFMGHWPLRGSNTVYPIYLLTPAGGGIQVLVALDGENIPMMAVKSQQDGLQLFEIVSDTLRETFQERMGKFLKTAKREKTIIYTSEENRIYASLVNPIFTKDDLLRLFKDNPVLRHLVKRFGVKKFRGLYNKLTINITGNFAAQAHLDSSVSFSTERLAANEINEGFLQEAIPHEMTHIFVKEFTDDQILGKGQSVFEALIHKLEGIDNYKDLDSRMQMNESICQVVGALAVGKSSILGVDITPEMVQFLVQLGLIESATSLAQSSQPKQTIADLINSTTPVFLVHPTTDQRPSTEYNVYQRFLASRNQEYSESLKRSEEPETKPVTLLYNQQGQLTYGGGEFVAAVKRVSSLMGSFTPKKNSIGNSAVFLGGSAVDCVQTAILSIVKALYEEGKSEFRAYLPSSGLWFDGFKTLEQRLVEIESKGKYGIKSIEELGWDQILKDMFRNRWVDPPEEHSYTRITIRFNGREHVIHEPTLEKKFDLVLDIVRPKDQAMKSDAQSAQPNQAMLTEIQEIGGKIHRDASLSSQFLGEYIRAWQFGDPKIRQVVESNTDVFQQHKKVDGYLKFLREKINPDIDQWTEEQFRSFWDEVLEIMVYVEQLEIVDVIVQKIRLSELIINKGDAFARFLQQQGEKSSGDLDVGDIRAIVDEASKGHQKSWINSLDPTAGRRFRSEVFNMVQEVLKDSAQLAAQQTKFSPKLQNYLRVLEIPYFVIVEMSQKLKDEERQELELAFKNAQKSPDNRLNLINKVLFLLNSMGLDNCLKLNLPPGVLASFKEHQDIELSQKAKRLLAPMQRKLISLAPFFYVSEDFIQGIRNVEVLVVPEYPGFAALKGRDQSDPLIVFNADLWNSLDDTQRSIILGHELAHVFLGSRMEGIREDFLKEAYALDEDLADIIAALLAVDTGLPRDSLFRFFDDTNKIYPAIKKAHFRSLTPDDEEEADRYRTDEERQEILNSLLRSSPDDILGKVITEIDNLTRMMIGAEQKGSDQTAFGKEAVNQAMVSFNRFEFNSLIEAQVIQNLDALDDSPFSFGDTPEGKLVGLLKSHPRSFPLIFSKLGTLDPSKDQEIISKIGLIIANLSDEMPHKIEMYAEVLGQADIHALSILGIDGQEAALLYGLPITKEDYDLLYRRTDLYFGLVASIKNMGSIKINPNESNKARVMVLLWKDFQEEFKRLNVNNTPGAGFNLEVVAQKQQLIILYNELIERLLRGENLQAEEMMDWARVLFSTENEDEGYKPRIYKWMFWLSMFGNKHVQGILEANKVWESQRKQWEQDNQKLDRELATDEAMIGLEQKDPAQSAQQDGAMTVERVNQIMAMEGFQERLGDIVQHLVINGVESSFHVNSPGEMTGVWKGLAVKANKGGFSLPGGVQKVLTGSETERALQEEQINRDFDIHSHPIRLKNESIHLVPVPSNGDLDFWRKKGVKYALIIWGEAGLGYYASLVNVEKLGDYSEEIIRKEGVVGAMRSLHEKGAIQFLKLEVASEGFVFGNDVSVGALKLNAIEIDLEEAIATDQRFLDSFSILDQKQQERFQRWEDRSYNQVREMNIADLIEEFRYSTLSNLIASFEQVGSMDWHMKQNLIQMVREEIAKVKGLLRAVGELTVDPNNERKNEILRKQVTEKTGLLEQAQQALLKLDLAMTTDSAQSAQFDQTRKEKGGIDFNADKMNLRVQNQNGEIKFKLDPAMLKQLQNAPGFTPVIINIQPMNNLKEFLGIKEKDVEQQASMV